MTPIDAKTSDEALFALFSKIAADWNAQKKPYAGYAASYDEIAKVRALRKFVKTALADHVPGFLGSAGCDIGCWLGFTCVLELASGAAHVFGIELTETFTTSSRNYAADHGLEQITFLPIKDGSVPVDSASIDWVLINQVLCNAYPNSFGQSLAEACRILKPGGTLLLCDSNNPYCSATVERLLATYRKYEVGDGTMENPAGFNIKRRMAIMRQAVPTLNEEQATLLAQNTAYCWGDTLKNAALDFSRTGKMPNSRFVENVNRTVVNPVTGAAHGNITDPYALAQEVEAHGMDVCITTSAGPKQHGDRELRQMLEKSQGFFIYGRKR
jgi:SAM-dependent methyltransferase